LIHLTTLEECEYVRSRGREPLADFKRFSMSFDLRYELIRQLFPEYSVANTSKFYHWYWNTYPFGRICEETGIPLQNYSPVFISHIITRGSHPEMAYDPRNCNLLSYEAHNRWESHHREEMRIFRGNEMRIKTLTDEWQQYTLSKGSNSPKK
jgi:hypothetical protein